MTRLTDRPGLPSTAELGARVRAERERLGLSAREVARRLAIGDKSYRQIEEATALPLGMLVALGRLGFDRQALAPELFRPE